jgi:hypothetical protein
MHHAPCTMHHAPCTMHYTLHTMHHALHTMHHALHTTHHALPSDVLQRPFRAEIALSTVLVLTMHPLCSAHSVPR